MARVGQQRLEKLDHQWLKDGCCPTVKDCTAERHVGIVNVCFQETLEDPSHQSFFPQISCSACAVSFVISDSTLTSLQGFNYR